MITLKQWMEVIQYKITEGSKYYWNCYGENAYTLDYWDGIQDGKSFSVIFDTENQTVYEVQVHDMKHNCAYRLFGSDDSRRAHTAEALVRGISDKVAWEGVNYVDLEVVEDWLEKATAIFNGKDYDKGVLIPLDFSDEELLKYMKMAHERNMTFNDFVNDALTRLIKKEGLFNDELDS